MIWRFLLLTLSLAHGSSYALPEPLDLHSALNSIDQSHPLVAAEQARLRALTAQKGASDSNSDWSATLSATGRWIEPPENSTLDNNDSHATLSLDKLLYDFGQENLQLRAWDLDIRAQQLRAQNALQQQRVDVAQSFYDALLSDLKYAVANEAMASAYVSFDKVQERHSLGQVSDIDLLASENEYQRVRLQRQRAASAQRNTRSLLAQRLNRPSQLPSNLIAPDLQANDNPLPDYEQLVQYALQHNPKLLALRLEQQAAGQRQSAAEANQRPTLTGNLSAHEYAQSFGGRAPLEASISLTVPLYRGSRDLSLANQQQARQDILLAEQSLLEQQLRQDILLQWQTIQTLQTQREQALVLQDYRDLYFDRSRALYELDMATDFGDAMVEQSAALLFQAETEYALSIAWMRLAYLLGLERFDPLAAPSPLLDSPSEQENAS